MAQRPLHLALLAAALLLGSLDASAEPRPLVELSVTHQKDPAWFPRVSWIGFSPDGKWLAVRFSPAEGVARVRVWKCRDWTATDADFGCHSRHGIPACVFHPTEPLLYAAGDGDLHTYSLPLKNPPQTVRLPEVPSTHGAVYSVDLASDRKTLRVTSVDRDGHTVRIDQCPLVVGGAPAKIFAERVGHVDGAPALSPDGMLLAVGVSAQKGGDFTYALDVWSTATSKRVAHFPDLNDWTAVVKFSPDGRMLAVGRMDATLSLFDLRTGKMTRTLNEDYTVSTVDFHPDRPFLAFGTYDRKGKQNVRVVDLPSGGILASLVADMRSIIEVRFSPDGKWLATVGNDLVVKVWELDRLIEK